ncbi:MAG: alkane 1-monooxygenase [Bacteroidia bacterium]
MLRNYKYSLSLVPAVFVITGNLLGGWWVALNTVFSLGLLVVLENFVPENKDNRTDDNQLFPEALLFIHVLMQVICLATLFRSISHFNYSAIQFFVLSISVGINTGASSIVIAHELIHRKNKFYQLAGKFLLFTAGNIYFFVDHLKVHHKYVGTSLDPATARYGESVYKFFLRTTFGQMKSSLKTEAQRLQNKNAFKYGLRNYVIASLLLLIIFYSALYYFIGTKAVVVFLIQSLVANFLLEYTNYIEHYGLTRKEDERVTEIHSWQSDKVISRYFLIDLSRHSDHHYYASKPYHTLNSYEKSPVLPGGYVSMIYYALIPPLWFKVIHKRIKKT